MQENRVYELRDLILEDVRAIKKEFDVKFIGCCLQFGLDPESEDDNFWLMLDNEEEEEDSLGGVFCTLVINNLSEPGVIRLLERKGWRKLLKCGLEYFLYEMDIEYTSEDSYIGFSFFDYGYTLSERNYKRFFES